MLEGFHVRAATAADYDHFVRLSRQLGVDDPVVERTRWEREMAPAILFGERHGDLIAYAWAQTLRKTGYIRHVVVDAAHRRHGFGRLLMDALASRFRAAGCQEWCLNVEASNLPALWLYTRYGLLRAWHASAVRVRWDLVASLPSPDRAHDARPIDPAEDAALEPAFGLPVGQLADARQRSFAVVRLVDRSAPDYARTGLAAFDPAFPGASPFRVSHPELARPLLEGLRAYARPEDRDLQLFIENDPALVRTLVALGATLKMEMLHLRGPLPPEHPWGQR